MGDDATGLVRALDERRQLVLAGGVDERLDADVAPPGLRLREQFVERADRLELRLARCQHLVRLVLRGLHVRLVEGVDLEHVARDRGRELPPVELAGEVVLVDEVELRALAVGPVGRLTGRRHESLPELAGRLRHELLGPEAEAGRRLVDADLVAPLLPPLAELETELEARIAVLLVAGNRHLRRNLQKAVDVDAHQRRRHDPEHRERRVAAADLRLAREDRAEAALVREVVQLGAGVGDRGELRPAAARLLPEVLELRARLDRRARLRGGEEEGLLQVDVPLEPSDRLGMRRIEHVERLDVERPPQHLGRERGAAHPEQDAVVELLGRRLRERVQLVDVVADARDDVEPAEPAILVRAGPERRVVAPDPLDDGVSRRARARGASP